MKSQGRAFAQAAYTLMSKSSLCVAMGTRATLTTGEQKSERDGEERERERRAEEGEVGEDPGEKRKRRGSAILIGLFINMYHLLREEPHVSHDTYMRIHSCLPLKPAFIGNAAF